MLSLFEFLKRYLKKVTNYKNIFGISFSFFITFILTIGSFFYFSLNELHVSREFPVKEQIFTNYDYQADPYENGKIYEDVQEYRKIIKQGKLNQNENISIEKNSDYELPSKSRVKININQIYDIEEKTSSFMAAGLISAEWDSNAIKSFDIKNRNDDIHLKSMNDILSTANLSFYDGENQIYEKISSKKIGDKSYSSYRFKGRFSMERVLNRFPFDKALLKITLEHQLPYTDIQLDIVGEMGDNKMRYNSYLAYQAVCSDDPYREAQNNEIGYYLCEMQGYSTLPRKPYYIESINEISDELKENITEILSSINRSPILNILIPIKRSLSSSYFRYIAPIMFGIITLSITDQLNEKYNEIRIATPPTILLTFIFMQTGFHSEIPQIAYVTYLDKLYVLSYSLCILSLSNAVVSLSDKNILNKHIYEILEINYSDLSRIIFVSLSILGPFLLWITVS